MTSLSNRGSSRKLSRPRISIILEPEYFEEDNSIREKPNLESITEHSIDIDSEDDDGLEDVVGWALDAIKEQYLKEENNNENKLDANIIDGLNELSGNNDTAGHTVNTSTTDLEDSKHSRSYSFGKENIKLKKVSSNNITDEKASEEVVAKVESSEPVLKSKVEETINEVYEILKENLESEELEKIMVKIEPLLNTIKDEYTKEASKNEPPTISTSSAPAVSGPPPPAPPPPPPPAPIVPKFKIKTKNATVTATECGITGGIGDIEIRIKSQPKKDDMMAQLRERMKARQNRQSLAMKYQGLEKT